MPAYVAMLRGINVSGHNPIKMDQLRKLCSGLGFQNVETYVQSGNIVFRTKLEDPASLAKRISETILNTTGFDVLTIVRTSQEMGKIVSSNPFLKEKNIDLSKLHVTFLSEPAKKSSLKGLEMLSGTDRFHATLCEIYLYCPAGYGRTKLSNTAIENALSVEATTRNWRTTNVLSEMASKL